VTEESANNRKQQRRASDVQSGATTGPSIHGPDIVLFFSLFSRSGRRRIMVNNEKRSTRSQANISDYFNKVPLDLSPLKQARSAARNADVIVATDSSDAGSSTSVTSGKKRSASPPPIDTGETVERELKRSKTSADENGVHGSSFSDWKFRVFPPSSNPSALPPSPVSGSTTPTRSIGSSPRARSVPPSIPTTPGHVPYLDLSKYRSPTKITHRVRVMSVPPSIRDGEEDEGGVRTGKTVDRDLDRTPVPRMVVEKVEKVRRNLDRPSPALVIAPASGSRNDDPFSFESDALLKTPVQKAHSLRESMSPLTPLGSLYSSDQSLPSTPPLLPNNDPATDPMNIDLPALPPQPPQPPQLEPPSKPKPHPRPIPTKQPSHLIPPQPRPLSFLLPSRSPTPPPQRVARARSASVDPPIPILPYPLVPSTSNPPASRVPEPEPILPVAPTIPNPQPPEKHDSPEISPAITTPANVEAAPTAPAPPPASGTVEADEKGKGKAKEQPPAPSKLPAPKPTKASRLRSIAVNAGSSGVTRTRALKVTARPSPMSRERRVTRSSTAKSRQADVLKEKGPTNSVTKPKEGDGVNGKVEKEREKDDTNIGISTVRSTLVLEREPDVGGPTFQRLRQRRLRRNHASRWVSLCPLPARKRSRDLPPRLNPSQPRTRFRPLENHVNMILPPP
jgi:hypothetical protein